MRLLCFLILAFTASFKALAQDADPHIYCDIFYETFDATCDQGGNNGGFSQDTRGTSNFSSIIRYDNAGWSSKGTCNAGAQCVRLGKSSIKESSSLSFSTIAANSNTSTSFKLRFRVGFWNTSSNVPEMYAAGKRVTVDKVGQMYDMEVALTNKSLPMSLELSNKTSQLKKYSYFFLDDVCLYQDGATTEQISKAHKLILTGTFDAEKLSALNDALKSNDNIVSIDAKTATFPSGSIITTGNPNCLIFAAESTNLVNATNLVKGEACASLVLKDGYPFCSDGDFTASQASYSRSFAESNQWYTMCLPFGISLSDCSGVTRLATVKDVDGDGIINYTSTSSVEANTPCLIQVADAEPVISATNIEVKRSSCMTDYLYGSAGTFEGCFTGIYHAVSSIASQGIEYVYGYSNSYYTADYPYRFFRLSEGTSSRLNPFRCFLALSKSVVNSSTTSMMAVRVDGQIAAVRDLKAVDAGSVGNVYDLSGRLILKKANAGALRTLNKGVYIWNGRKYMVK